MLSLQLFDLIYREETLFNVIKSVTRNGRSILLTALLALILVYLFSIVGFLFLKDDFILEVDRLPGNHSRGLGTSFLGWAWGGDNGHVEVAVSTMPAPLGSLPPPAGFWGHLAHTNLQALVHCSLGEAEPWKPCRPVCHSWRTWCLQGLPWPGAESQRPSLAVVRASRRGGLPGTCLRTDKSDAEVRHTFVSPCDLIPITSSQHPGNVTWSCHIYGHM